MRSRGLGDVYKRPVLDMYLDHLYFQGDDLYTGRLALYGAAWLRSLPTRGTADFPKAKEALAGWRKTAPEGAKGPLPWDRSIAPSYGAAGRRCAGPGRRAISETTSTQ